MRLSFAFMALGFAVISTMQRCRFRCITVAFSPRIQTLSFSSSQDSSTVASGKSSGYRARRTRPNISSDTLLTLVNDLHKSGKLPSYCSGALLATIEKSDVHVAQPQQEEDGIFFPQKGRNIEESVPRMRFAPSPTGRYIYL